MKGIITGDLESIKEIIMKNSHILKRTDEVFMIIYSIYIYIYIIKGIITGDLESIKEIIMKNSHILKRTDEVFYIII